MNTSQVLPGLSIIIVNYNTRELTLACLRSIEQYPPAGPYEIIVVDNQSTDGSVEAIREHHPQVELIVSQENLGFAGGNNLALRVAKYEILFLLNSDTEVHQDALVNLQKAFWEHPEMAAAGGKLLNTDGSLQYSIRHDPRLTNAFSEMVFLHRLFTGPWWGEMDTNHDHYETFHPVEYVIGAYLAVRREWYEKVGGLDRGFFMYSEEADWCKRIRAAGGRIYFLPDSVITHHGRGSSPNKAHLNVILFLSRERYARLHFNWIKALLYRMILVGGLSMRSFFNLFFAPFCECYWEGACWRAKAAWKLLTDPLPLKPRYD